MAGMRRAGFMKYTGMAYYKDSSHQNAEDRRGMAMTGLKALSQFLLTALFALTISLLTFAASFADVPKSTYLPIAALTE